jgi:hypothetical protein
VGMDRVSKLALMRNTRRAAPGPVSEMTGTFPVVCPGSSHTTHLFGPVDCGPHTEGRWRAGTRPGPSREEYTSAGEFRDSPPVRGTNLVGVP